MHRCEFKIGSGSDANLVESASCVFEPLASVRPPQSMIRPIALFSNLGNQTHHKRTKRGIASYKNVLGSVEVGNKNAQLPSVVIDLQILMDKLIFKIHDLRRPHLESSEPFCR